MLGAFLIGSPKRSRNRGWFRQLYARSGICDAGVYYSVAKNAAGERARISGLLVQEAVSLDLLDPFPEETAPDPPFSKFFDLYTPLAESMPPDELLAPDILMTGVLSTVSLPSRGVSLCFGTSAGRSDKMKPYVLGMISDDRDVPLSEKVRAHVSGALEEGEAGHVFSIGPNVCLQLVRNRCPIYAYLVLKRGNMYFTWSSSAILPTADGDEFIWPVGNFNDGKDRSALGIDLKAVRKRWLRNNNHAFQSGDNLAKSIALFHRWLCNHIV